MINCLRVVRPPESLPRQHVMRLAHSRVIPAVPPFLQGALGALGRLLSIPQVAVGMGTPEVIRTSKHRVLELLHPSLLPEEEVQGVLHAAQKIERVGEAQYNVQRAPVALIRWQVLDM